MQLLRVGVDVTEASVTVIDEAQSTSTWQHCTVLWMVK